jgi:hypothetical protein
MLTGTSPNMPCHYYGCSNTAVFEDYSIGADAGPLFFSVDTHSVKSMDYIDDRGLRSTGSLIIQGRYLSPNDAMDAPLSNTTITLSAWLPVYDDWCEEDQDTGDPSDTGDQSDTGDHSDTGSHSGTDSGSAVMDDTGEMTKLPVPSSGYRVDGICYEWHYVNAIEFYPLAAGEIEIFDFIGDPTFDWDSETVFQLALTGRGSAAVEISVRSDVGERGACWSGGTTCKSGDPEPPKDASMENKYSSDNVVCDPDAWTFSELANPEP